MNTSNAPLTCFSLTISDHVAQLVLNRPEAMNTMNPAFWRELDGVLTQLHRNANARALVISSTGKHFSAGMALDMFGGAITMDDASAEGRAAIFDLLTEMQGTFTKLETLRIPVIAAIQGGCIGGAVDMVTAACIRYRHDRRLLLHPGDQHRHGGRRGHAAAPAQADSAGRGERAGLHRSTPERAKGAGVWPGQ